MYQEGIIRQPDRQLELRKTVLEYIKNHGVDLDGSIFTIPNRDDIPKKSREDQEALFQPYAKEFYAEFGDEPEADPELSLLLERIAKNSKDHRKYAREHVEEYLVGIVDLMDGDSVPEYEAMLDRVNVDYRAIIDSKKIKLEGTKAERILDGILKAKSLYVATVENANHQVEFNGFDSDEETKEFPRVLQESFGQELLEKCLISNISYDPSKVNVRFGDGDYYLSDDAFLRWQKQMPIMADYTYVGDSYTSWNTDPEFAKTVIPTPIRFFSFSAENPDEYKYLDHLDEEDKSKAYKLANFAHQIGHHMYAYLMPRDKRENWKSLVDKNPFVTKFVEETYADDEDLKYEQSFTESVGLYVAVPEYLKKHNPDFYEYIANNFSQIKSPELFQEKLAD